MRETVRLSVSSRLAGPIALGRSEICLPRRALIELSPRQLEGVLAHELAHLARRDPGWRLVAGLLGAVFFFQPMNRLAARRLSESAEFLADEWAAARTGSRLHLARSLVEVAGWLSPSREPVPAAGLADHDSPLVLRVERLLTQGPLGGEVSRRLQWATACLLVLGVAFFSPVVSVGEPPPTARSRVLEIEPAAMNPWVATPMAVPAAVQVPSVMVVPGMGVLISESPGQFRVVVIPRDLERRLTEIHRQHRLLVREFRMLRREMRVPAAHEVPVGHEKTPVPDGIRGPLFWI
jgi:hypothetical protein